MGMMRRLGCGWGWAALVIVTTGCEPEALEIRAGPEPRAEGLLAYLRDSLPTEFAGQVLLSVGDELVLDAVLGLADEATGVEVARETAFDIGSLTKAFTAATVVRLADQGKLDLLDTLGLFVPDLTPPASRIVLRDLLTHTAGLPRYSGDDYEPRSWEDLVDWLRAGQVDSTLVGRFSYSNPGYAILAGVVSLVAGDDFEAVLRREILGSVTYPSVGYVRAPSPGPQAVGYVGGERFGRPTEHPWGPEGPWWNLRGNGGLLASGRDLWQWHRALASGEILSVASADRLFQPYVAVDEGRLRWYGYGWYIRRTPLGTVVDHTGGNGAFFAIVRWWRDKDVSLVVTNSNFDGATAAALLRRVEAWVAEQA